MTGLTSQDWFWPALIVVVGLPIMLLILTELANYLTRRRSSFARPVQLLRNYVLPACALFLLVDQVEHTNVHATWSRIAATVFGFLVMLFLLSGANAVLFGEARAGSWRERLPTIFIDLGRLVLIVVGIGVLLSWVWGTDIGGLITAVGVTSIVIGLAVQSAVGPVIAGLLMLFEQPFRIGDSRYLDAKGRVVEVNWRSAHIDTGNGIRSSPTGRWRPIHSPTSAGSRAPPTGRAPHCPSPRLTGLGSSKPLLAVADELPREAPEAPRQRCPPSATPTTRCPF